MSIRSLNNKKIIIAEFKLPTAVKLLPAARVKLRNWNRTELQINNIRLI
jgi:hypothetical protein